jgi:RNA polymerase sigma-70 factor (ECF subfamily)
MRSPRPHEAKVEELHRRHAWLVLAALSRAGVPTSDVEDQAHELWLSVLSKIAAGETEPDAWPAYLTALARGRAANHRRAALHRRADSLAEEPGVASERLSAEQVLILYGVIESIPNPDQREAALLRAQGYSIREIAAAQGITEAGVKKRLLLAGEQLEKALKRDEEDEEKAGVVPAGPGTAPDSPPRATTVQRSGAFWGFGTFEELLDALAEERERQWKDIEDAIRRTEMPVEPPRSTKPVAAPLLHPFPVVSGLGRSRGTMAALTAAAVFAGAYLGARGNTGQATASVAVCPEPPPAPRPAGTPATDQPAAPAQATATARAEAAQTVAMQGTAGQGTAAVAAKRPVRSALSADDLEGLLRREREDRGAREP